MSSDIAWLDLRLRRRLTIGYTLGMAVYAAVVVALYPSFKNDSSLNALTEKGSTVTALLGASGTLTSPAGWLSANLYANFVPLVVLLATIGYGASCIAGQDEDATLGLVTALPLTRRAIITGKLAALFAQALPVPIITAVCVFGGRGLGLRVGAGALLGITGGVILLGLVFGSMALAVGAATGSRGLALGVSSSAAAIAYLTSSLAPTIHWLHPARYASPFFYAVDDSQLVRGMPLAWIAVLALITAAFATTALIAFNRLDVH
ncbi:ABC transporter permease [Mycobacterium sp. 852002-50816_SCH5313054-b]|uniref:ABC transporter permease subunit n=1 Tax=Mycobacterium sp. 852002-50816_SCH5313054-b TaxID=1834092 RepID=UPI0007FEF025|nr:ABC transporter permease subunit [Mycobacterium sp. 852002-50816_SCH5313054-b]OBF55322.1 ABC transporter permease [Mycobacterium sp. 852002-50816_SCH5313054-b]